MSHPMAVGPAMQPFPVGGTTVEYTDSGGDGAPILLVHAGVFGAWFAPLAVDPALRDFRVVRMLRAGYTSGSPPTGHLSIGDHAAHCAALLEGSTPRRRTSWRTPQAVWSPYSSRTTARTSSAASSWANHR